MLSCSCLQVCFDQLKLYLRWQDSSEQVSELFYSDLHHTLGVLPTPLGATREKKKNKKKKIKYTTLTHHPTLQWLNIQQPGYTIGLVKIIQPPPLRKKDLNQRLCAHLWRGPKGAMPVCESQRERVRLQPLLPLLFKLRNSLASNKIYMKGIYLT